MHWYYKIVDKIDGQEKSNSDKLDTVFRFWQYRILQKFRCKIS